MLSKNLNTNKHYWRGNEITEEEYNKILQIILSKPIAPEGFDYILTNELIWELCEIPDYEPAPLDDIEEKAKAYDILMGAIE